MKKSESSKEARTEAKRTKYYEILADTDPKELALVAGIIDGAVFCEIEMEDLRKLPFIVTKPGDPSKQKVTPAARQYQKTQAMHANNIRILLNVLRKVESDATNELLKRLEEFTL
jgi:proline dehydrogenase